MYKEYRFYVYIVSNFERTVIYAGFTNNLIRRLIEHKNGIGSQFTSKYKTTDLLFYEEYKYVNRVIAREKEIKGWTREKKFALIKSVNPGLTDLSGQYFLLNNISKEDIESYLKDCR